MHKTSNSVKKKLNPFSKQLSLYCIMMQLMIHSYNSKQDFQKNWNLKAVRLLNHYDKQVDYSKKW